ncbi:MAG TPA: sodium:calcium antiporter [Halococcus sp.]|nr:sodium:calcium antiporter [Halococcus sp.]
MALSVCWFANPLLIGGTAIHTVLLIGAFILLLVGAGIFTNGVEWLGQQLGFGDSATGSILAAVGTAMPETMIPVIAILSAFLSKSQSDAHGIGVGAILGAPFLLATIAMFLIGVSVWYFSDRREHDTQFHVNTESTQRDLSFFFVGYSLAFLAAFIPSRLVTIAIGVFLVVWYAFYVYRTVQNDDFVEGEELNALYLGTFVDNGIGPIPGLGSNPRGQANDPDRWIVGLQTLIAVGIIIGGAELFVLEVEYFSNEVFNIPAAVIALLLAPLATELPEKFNSVLWISRDKDTLAIGNITGAMAFQGTLPVTLGILFTPWNLTLQWGTTGFLNSFSAILALVGGTIVYLRVRSADGDTMHPAPFLISGLLYVAFIAVLVYHVLVFTL